jgi:hypothetical protein
LAFSKILFFSRPFCIGPVVFYHLQAIFSEMFTIFHENIEKFAFSSHPRHLVFDVFKSGGFDVISSRSFGWPWQPATGSHFISCLEAYRGRKLLLSEYNDILEYFKQSRVLNVPFHSFSLSVDVSSVGCLKNEPR